MIKPSTLSIQEKIEALHREIDALINARVEQIRKENGYNVPETMVRRDEFEKGSNGCICRMYQMMREKS